MDTYLENSNEEMVNELHDSLLHESNTYDNLLRTEQG